MDDLQVVTRPVLMHLLQQARELGIYLADGSALAPARWPAEDSSTGVEFADSGMATARPAGVAGRDATPGAMSGKTASRSLPVSAAMESELVPSGLEGAALPGTSGAAGVIAIAYYRRRWRVTPKNLGNQAVPLLYPGF